LSLVTVALVVAFVLIAGSLTFASVRALAFWRTSREFFSEFGRTTDTFAAALDRLASSEPPDLYRLATATARLEASRARLGVLTGALGRVREQWSSVLGLYPKK
jgi:hypothetical protein